MFSKRELISSPAHGAIVDGDDLHMIGSFEADEENSSVIANASCRTRSIPVGLASYPTKATKNLPIDEIVGDGEKFVVQLSKGSLKVKKILRKVRRKLPLRLRRKSFLFGSSTNTVAEYEEMIENSVGLEEAENYCQDSDAETIASVRSSRNNVRTGMGMLIRQKAQVMNRPSSAFSNRGIAQSPSPSPKNNYRSMLLRGKSLVLDDCSIGGMSDITEDASAVYAFPQTINHPSFRRTPMFINANTYRINEDEDESESDSEEFDNRPCEDDDDENDTGDIERAYDFRELSPLNDGLESTVGEVTPRFSSPDGSDKTATRFNAYDRIRRRVYSDSDIDSGARLSSNISSLTLSSNFEDRRSSGSSRFIGKQFERLTAESSGPTPPRKVAPYTSWPFPRTRTYSDSYVDQPTTNTDYQRVEIQNPGRLENTFAGLSRNHSKSHDGLISDVILKIQSSRRQSLPLSQRNGKNLESLRSRTYSDSIVHKKSVREDILWDPLSTSLLDTEASIASQIHVNHQKKLSPSNDHRKAPATSSVLATLSHTNTKIFVAAESKKPQRRQQLQQPSPRTLSAASMIAVALLPTPAKHLPAVPSPSTRKTKSTDNYYWGNIKDASENIDESREMELKDLCSWSSDSYDDIF